MFLYLLTTSGFLYLGATVILSQRDFSAVEGCSVHHVMDSSIPGPHTLDGRYTHTHTHSCDEQKERK